MKILIVNSLYPPFVIGGAEVSSQKLALELANAGNEVFILTTGEADIKEESNGIKIYRRRFSNIMSFWEFKHSTPVKRLKFLWLNVSFLRYLKKNHSTGIHLGVNVPWLKPDVVCIHDVNSIANPQFFSKYHYFKTKLEKKLAVKKGKKVFTVSRFSAEEIAKYVGGYAEDYPVVPCAWQHMEKIKTKGDSKSKFGVEKGSYFFSLSSMAPTKNFKWVMEAAKQNKDQTFIIAGGTDPKTFGISSLKEEVPNVRYVGRVSDEDAKLLMRDCKVFLFPSYYEGFGIPPMEALACGAPEVVVSDIPVMHEVYGASVHYVDPFNYQDIDMEKNYAIKGRLS